MELSNTAAHRPVVRSRRGRLAVGREGDGHGITAMPLKRPIGEAGVTFIGSQGAPTVTTQTWTVSP